MPQIFYVSCHLQSTCDCLAGQMWCVDDCKITSKTPFTGNSGVHVRHLPDVSWCLIWHRVILSIFASGMFPCSRGDFARNLHIWSRVKDAIFIAEKLFLAENDWCFCTYRNVFIFREFANNNNKNVSFLYGDCDQISSLQGKKQLLGVLTVHFPELGKLLNISCLFLVC